MASAHRVGFADIAAEVMAFVTEIVYCTVTTVDPHGRPRSRIMHPIFTVVDGAPQGWALTDRTPVKAHHLAENPYVCCSYWSPSQNTVSLECLAEWAEDEDTKHRVWALFRDTPPPLGWGDLSGYEPGGIHHPHFHPLRLTPWRVQLLTGEQFAAGDFTPRIWRTDLPPA